MLLAFALPAAAESPPENIIEHYEWCLLPKYRPASIARFEEYFQKHHPHDEEYEDAIHLRFVRLSAFRLVELYVDEGNRKKAKFYLSWLMKADPAISDESRAERRK